MYILFISKKVFKQVRHFLPCYDSILCKICHSTLIFTTCFCVTEPENILKVFARALRTSYTRRALIVGCGLQAIQQLCGINTVM